MSAFKKMSDEQIAADQYQQGIVLFDALKLEDSLPYFKSALEHHIQEPDYWLAYITALIQTQRLDQAQQTLNYGIDAGLNGSRVDALQGLLNTQLTVLNILQATLIDLFERKQYTILEEQVQQALQQNPHWLIGWKILSDALLIQGKDARNAAKQALALNIEDASEHCYYGLALKNQGDLIGATKAFEQAIALQPGYAAAYNNLGVVYKDMGNFSAAVQHYQHALKLNPNYASCYSNYLFCLTHTEKIEQKALFDAHIGYGKQFEASAKKQWQAHLNSRNPLRQLNIGFVSGDFRTHSIAYFLEPLLYELAKSSSIQLVAYSNNVLCDATTARLKSQFAHWYSIENLSDDVLAQKIRNDGIDILVDLSGHTANNRLTTFAKKPAPIQVSWLGYLATTGLRAMDYYMADTCCIPAHSFNKQSLSKQFTEKLVRLPANAAFMRVEDAPEVNALPALSNGYITFACFNRVSKISASTVKLWASLMHAVPNSKMLLGAMPESGSYDHLITWFGAQGISQSRLIFHQRSDVLQYLALHQQVDLCLDTFPSSGVTTTCHAAWMGVPTLCITGKTLASRGAMAVMQHAKLNNFIAQNTEQFVLQGAHFAKNIEMLDYVRKSLRQRLRQSALLQPAALAHNIEQAFRQMWQTWCERKPTVSFEIKS